MFFRKSTLKDRAIMTEILTNSFFEYPVFTSFLPQEKHRKKFLNALFYGNIGAFEKIDSSYVAVNDNNEITGIILFMDPKKKEPKFWNYVKESNWKLLTIRNLKSLADFFKVIYDMDQNLINQEDSWYVDTLAVNKKYQGQGIGSKIFQEFFFDYVKKHGNEKIKLSTNTLPNTYFYKKNGFKEVDHEKSKYGFDTWHFEKLIS